LHASSIDGDILIDVTRDFVAQSRTLRGVDLVLLTHSHRDATGGLSRLDRWLAARSSAPVTVMASRATLRSVRRRHPRLRHLVWRELPPGRRRHWRGTVISAIEVPHSPGCTTYAWKLRRAGVTLVYASDVARLTPGLRRFCRGADLLVIDGAMWGRTLFTHLNIQAALPHIARWDVRRVLFTQIGKSTPAHEVVDAWLRRQCPRTAAAYDGMVVQLQGRHRAG
jgi:phosphoribosyl 1,2-cyclic phosphodiesterase